MKALQQLAGLLVHLLHRVVEPAVRALVELVLDAVHRVEGAVLELVGGFLGPPDPAPEAVEQAHAATVATDAKSISAWAAEAGKSVVGDGLPRRGEVDERSSARPDARIGVEGTQADGSFLRVIAVLAPEGRSALAAEDLHAAVGRAEAANGLGAAQEPEGARGDARRR